MITRLGGKLYNIISSKTNYLVCGQWPGETKVRQAKAKGVEILEEDDFWGMIDEARETLMEQQGDNWNKDGWYPEGEGEGDYYEDGEYYEGDDDGYYDNEDADKKKKPLTTQSNTPASKQSNNDAWGDEKDSAPAKKSPFFVSAGTATSSQHAKKQQAKPAAQNSQSQPTQQQQQVQEIKKSNTVQQSPAGETKKGSAPKQDSKAVGTSASLKKQTSWSTSLPSRMLVQILEFIYTVDVVTSQAVCKGWKLEGQASDKIWKAVYLHNFENGTADSKEIAPQGKDTPWSERYHRRAKSETNWRLGKCRISRKGHHLLTYCSSVSAFGKSGRQALLACSNGKVLIFDATTERTSKSIMLPNKVACNAIYWNEPDRHLYTADHWNTYVKQWKVNDLVSPVKQLKQYDGHDPSVQGRKQMRNFQKASNGPPVVRVVGNNDWMAGFWNSYLYFVAADSRQGMVGGLQCCAFDPTSPVPCMYISKSATDTESKDPSKLYKICRLLDYADHEELIAIVDEPVMAMTPLAAGFGETLLGTPVTVSTAKPAKPSSSSSSSVSIPKPGGSQKPVKFAATPVKPSIVAVLTDSKLSVYCRNKVPGHEKVWEKERKAALKKEQVTTGETASWTEVASVAMPGLHLPELVSPAPGRLIAYSSQDRRLVVIAYAVRHSDKSQAPVRVTLAKPQVVKLETDGGDVISGILNTPYKLYLFLQTAGEFLVADFSPETQEQQQLQELQQAASVQKKQQGPKSQPKQVTKPKPALDYDGEYAEYYENDYDYRY